MPNLFIQFNMHCDMFYLFPSLCFGHLDQATDRDLESGATTCRLGPANAIYLPSHPTTKQPHDGGNKQNLVCRQCIHLSILLDYRQQQTDRNTKRENARRYDYNYVVGNQILICKDGILRKSESRYNGPWTITQIHTNGTIRVQHGTRSEQLNIRRVTPYHPPSDEGSET